MRRLGVPRLHPPTLLQIPGRVSQIRRPTANISLARQLGGGLTVNQLKESVRNTPGVSLSQIEFVLNEDEVPNLSEMGRIGNEVSIPV